MTFRYTGTNGRAVKFEVKMNLCEKKGVISVCKAVTLDDQHGCKFRIGSSTGPHCMHFRERMCGACDSILAQMGEEPYKCKDCEKFRTCGLKNTSRECTMEEKQEKIGGKSE